MMEAEITHNIRSNRSSKREEDMILNESSN